jgi:hypothetical protein
MLGITFRLDYTLTPDLSIQYYGQPFIASGKYSNYKRITHPHASHFNDRFDTFTGDRIAYNPTDGTLGFDEDGDGNADYTISKPNFNFREFRSNLVVRWEYRRGSTLFLVWSQGRSSFGNSGIFSYKNDMQDLFGVKAHNIFLIKFSYWFSR